MIALSGHLNLNYSFVFHHLCVFKFNTVWDICKISLDFQLFCLAKAVDH